MEITDSETSEIPGRIGQAKRIPKGTIQLQFAGDLILARCQDRDLSGLFKRYEAIFEAFANMERHERMVNYKFLNALMLTSYAKKALDNETKRDLFNKKNELFMDIVGNIEQRKKVAFKYLASKNFRVLEFCKACTEKNEAEGLAKHDWKFCKSCNVDRNFYSVLSLYHRYDGGSACIFLSNDLISKLPVKNFKLKGKIEDYKEEARYRNFIYSIKNLDAIDLKSVLEMHKRILKK
jgi:hypothetical protein